MVNTPGLGVELLQIFCPGAASKCGARRVRSGGYFYPSSEGDSGPRQSCGDKVNGRVRGYETQMYYKE